MKTLSKISLVLLAMSIMQCQASKNLDDLHPPLQRNLINPLKQANDLLNQIIESIRNAPFFASMIKDLYLQGDVDLQPNKLLQLLQILSGRQKHASAIERLRKILENPEQISEALKRKLEQINEELQRKLEQMDEGSKQVSVHSDDVVGTNNQGNPENPTLSETATETPDDKLLKQLTGLTLTRRRIGLPRKNPE